MLREDHKLEASGKWVHMKIFGPTK